MTYAGSLVQPYDDQLAAVEAAVKHGRGIISMPTGTGKSLVIKLIIQKFNLKTLVIVPSLEIKRQLAETLKGLKNVVVENIDSSALTTATDFDVLIIDEAHHTAARTYQKLNQKSWTGIYYRFFLTATPFRSDNEETLLFESIAGQVIFKLDYKTAIAKGYIVPVDAYYIEIPKQETDAYTYAEVYSKLVVRNDIRNAKIAQLVDIIRENTVFTLILVKEVAHGQILAELTNIPFVSGEDVESRNLILEHASGTLQELIGTTGILGEGVDTKATEYVVIAGLGKSKGQFMQQVGRAVRKYPGKESAKIILIQDKSHKFLTRHFKAQCAILLEEYGVKPLKLEI